MNISFFQNFVYFTMIQLLRWFQCVFRFNVDITIGSSHLKPKRLSRIQKVEFKYKFAPSTRYYNSILSILYISAYYTHCAHFDSLQFSANLQFMIVFLRTIFRKTIESLSKISRIKIFLHFNNLKIWR